MGINTVYQEPCCQHITIIPYIWTREHRHDRYLPTLPMDGQTDDSATPWVCIELCQCVYCVPGHEFKAMRWIIQPFLTCWLLRNLTWCTLRRHILGVAAVKMQYWWYFYKYFALIASTDAKCILLHGAWCWLSRDLYKCIIELTHGLERDSI